MQEGVEKVGRSFRREYRKGEGCAGGSREKRRRCRKKYKKEEGVSGGSSEN